MRRLSILSLCLAAMLLGAIGAGAQGVIHGNGDPRVITPTPNCASSRFYVDDTTGKMYQANTGSPCVWSDSSAAAGLPAGVSSDGANGLTATGGYTAGTQFTFPDATKQVSAAYNTVGILVSPSCPTGSTTCIKIFGDGKKEVDCTANSTTTLVCPSGNFTAADVGKVIWATSDGTGASAGKYLSTTFVCPYTTIASVTNSTTVVLSNACTVTNAGATVAYWGHDDGATLAAVNWGCNVAHLATASSMIFTSQPFFKTNNCNDPFTAVMGGPNAALLGDGFGASQAQIELTPNFAWGSCPAGSGCIGSAARVVANLQVHASGLTAAANTNCAAGNSKIVVSAYSVSSEIYGVDLAGICPGATGMEGMRLNNADEMATAGGVQDVGTIACSAVTGKAMAMYANDCINPDVSGGLGIQVSAGAQLAMYSSYPAQNVTVTGSSELDSFASSYQGTLIVNSGTWVSYRDDLASGNATLQVDAAGIVFSGNTTFKGITNSGSFTSNGGNKFGAGVTSNAGATWWGPDILTFGCSGTVATSSTVFLSNVDAQPATLPCNTTVQGVGNVYIAKRAPLSGSHLGLNCTTSASSTGVISVLLNGNTNYTTGGGSGTTITATFTAATAAQNSGNFLVPGNLGAISMQVVTTTGTMVNPRCTLLNW